MISNSVDSLPLPPGRMGLPFVGEAIAWLTDSDFVDKRFTHYGNIYRTKVFGFRLISVRGRETCEQLSHYEGRTLQNALFPNTRALMGEHSLAGTEGSAHQNRRAILADAFQPRRLETYQQYVEETCTRYLVQWSERDRLTLFEEVPKLAFDLLGKFFCGLEGASETELYPIVRTWSGGLFSLLPRWADKKLRAAYRSRDEFAEFVESETARRTDEPGDDAFDILVRARDENSEPLSVNAIRDLSLNLIGIWSDTISSVLTSFCLLVGQDATLKDQLRAEVQASRSSAGTSAGHASLLDATISEVLRLHPPIPACIRTVTDTFEVNGYQFPKGWLVLYDIRATHSRTEDGDSFRPNRFLNGGEAEQIAFGVGPRECIAKSLVHLELRIFCSQLLTNFDWEILPDQDLEMQVLPVPRPKSGLEISLMQTT